jgi:hypothetical protein
VRLERAFLISWSSGAGTVEGSCTMTRGSIVCAGRD